MSTNPTGFKITDSANGWNRADFNDVFINKDCFVEGNLWTWGSPSNGLLGNNTSPAGAAGRTSSPVQTISSGTNWKSVGVGLDHVVAIKTDGTLWTWGLGSNAALGTGSLVSVSSPVQTISAGTNWKQASVGGAHSAAIKSDGTLWMWGLGAAGRLGDNTIVSKSSPVQTIAGGNNWRSVSAGCAHTLAIKTDNTLWAWGYGSYGRLGNETITDRSSPAQVIGGPNWKSSSGGDRHSAGIKIDGSLWLWGCGRNGALGNESLLDVSSPVQTISAGTNWKQVSAGGLHTAAIKTDGSLWTWGFNFRNQLGMGTGISTSMSSPIQTVTAGTNWKQVSAGPQTTGAIKTDGTLWMWGAGFYGMHGDNSYAIQRGSPVQTIAGGNSWKSIETGSKSTISIRG